MRDWIVKKRLKELSVNGVIPAKAQYELIKEYRNDVKNGIPPEESEARTILILANEKLILYTANEVLKTNIFDKEASLYFVGMQALMEAIEKFNENQYSVFTTFAVTMIRNRMIIHIYRSRKETLKIVFLSDLVTCDDDLEFEIPDGYDVAETDDEIDLSDTTKEILKYFKYLNPLRQQILLDKFGFLGHKRKSFVEISLEQNLTHQRVNGLCKDALQKLSIMYKSRYDKTLIKQRKKLLKHKHVVLPEVEEYLNQSQLTI
ncbi:MAG: hypothetical protein IKM43_02855 [Clostridia bacterium]|nr:hypothetical protein [Clostridia bacterium]